MIFYSIVGGITSVLISGGLASCGVAYLLEQWSAARHDVHERHTKEARRELGLTLIAQSCWFSEEPEVQAAFQTLGEHLRDRGTLNVSDVRDRWQKRRAAG